jgi:DNA-binding transcriptional LysR family regulator
MRVNLNQLRCFYLAAKFKSVSKAASALFVTPSAVTMQIKKLERWIGFPLLIREGNSLKITQAAESIFTQAEKVFQEAEALEHQIEKMMHSRKNEVVIGAHHVLAKYILPNLVPQLKRMHPELHFQIVLDTVPALLDRLKTNELHFVLSSSLRQAVDIRPIPLFSEELVLVTLKGSKHIRKKTILPEEITSIPLLLQERNISIVNQYIRAKNITPEVVLENISADVIKQFIRQDVGGALLMRFTVQEELNSGLLQEIKVVGGLPCAEFVLAYQEKNTLATHVQKLVSSLETNTFCRDNLACPSAAPTDGHSGKR